MSSLKNLCIIAVLMLFVSLSFAQTSKTISSPDKRITVDFLINDKGNPLYSVAFKNKTVIKNSPMGFVLADGVTLTDNFEITEAKEFTVDETWKPVWGEVKEIRNHYNELRIHLKQKSGKALQLNIVFRVFNDGVGFRYEIPFQPNLDYFVITEEKTHFNLTGNHKAFWIPGDYDTNEYPYTTSALSEVDAVKVKDATPEISTRYIKDPSSVQTPLMMKTADGLYINIHEAALVNYPAMQLHVNKDNFELSSNLVPDAFDNKAYLQTPAKTPWRTIIMSDKATDILASKIILNLNEPSAIKETSWIKPQKFIGIWWGMHVDAYSWSYANNTQDVIANKPHGHHGATTQRTKEYIDFAAKNGIDGVLVEGWNKGWEDWFGKWKENVFDFITPYPDFDVKTLAAYAKSKKVKLIMHHETSGSVTNYERLMDTAYRFMKQFGYDAVKTGYVGKIIPRGEHHDGQWMINHYNRVAQKTAEYKIMVDMHEPVRPTGLHRTYPNWLASEAARGNEFNAWSKGNMPEHETILPFTRLMGGPMDYTPGIFQIKLDKYGKKGNQPHTTLCKQLALYITMYSPVQMAADMIENYQSRMDAFQFIKDVAVDWDDTKIIEAEPGDYITIARKAKGNENWFIGGITDENSRRSEFALNFLTPGKKYVATIYRDADNAQWQSNPEAYKIEKVIVNAETVLKINMAEGGGFAISLFAASKADELKYAAYK